MRGKQERSRARKRIHAQSGRLRIPTTSRSWKHHPWLSMQLEEEYRGVMFGQHLLGDLQAPGLRLLRSTCLSLRRFVPVRGDRPVRPIATTQLMRGVEPFEPHLPDQRCPHRDCKILSTRSHGCFDFAMLLLPLATARCTQMVRQRTEDSCVRHRRSRRPMWRTCVCHICRS